MKINLTIFKKEFFGVEIESDPKLFTGLDSAKPNSEETAQQLQYVVTDVQYEQLKKIKHSVFKLGEIPFPKDSTENDRDIWKNSYSFAMNCISNIISSYEHFKEKREGIENEKSKK